MLVGINFAKLTDENDHAFAVPGNVAAEFLRRSKADGEIVIHRTEDQPKVNVDPHSLTVYVEVLSDERANGMIAENDGSEGSIISDIANHIKSRLPELSDQQLMDLSLNGDLKNLYSPESAAEVTSVKAARIRGNMTIIQVLRGRSTRSD